MEVPSKRVLFLQTFRLSHDWSLPDSIIYQITKNPATSKVYEKFIQSCKYFFIRNPILVIPIFKWNVKWNAQTEKFGKVIDVSNVVSKYWFTDELECYLHEAPAVSLLIPKLYRSTLKKSRFLQQIFTFAQFSLLCSNLVKIVLCKIVILNEDNSIVPLEELLAVLPKIKFVSIFDSPDYSLVTSETAKKLLEIPHFSKISCFVLENISEIFDVETFLNYFENDIYTFFKLEFCSSISDVFKIRLESLADQIIEKKIHGFVCFDELELKKKMKMSSLSGFNI